MFPSLLPGQSVFSGILRALPALLQETSGQRSPDQAEQYHRGNGAGQHRSNIQRHFPDIVKTFGDVQEVIPEQFHKNAVDQVEIQRHRAQPGQRLVAEPHLHHHQEAASHKYKRHQPLDSGAHQPVHHLQRITPFAVIAPAVVDQPFRLLEQQEKGRKGNNQPEPVSLFEESGHPLLMLSEKQAQREKDDAVVPPFSPHPPVILMVNKRPGHRIAQRKHKNPEDRRPFPFAETEGGPERQVEERDDNRVPGVDIGHMQAGEVPEDLCQIHLFPHQQPDAGMEKLGKIKGDHDRQHPAAEKPFQIVRLALKAFIQSQAAAEKKHAHQHIAHRNKGIHPVYDKRGRMPRRAGFLRHMMQRDTKRGDALQDLCLFQGGIVLIPFTAAGIAGAPEDQPRQQKVKQIHPVHIRFSLCFIRSYHGIL